MAANLAWQMVATGPAQLLIASVWQGLVLTAIAWGGLTLAARSRFSLRASTRFAVWLTVFLLVALLPALTVMRGLLGHASLPAPSSDGWTLRLDENWALAIEIVWLLASLLSLFRLGIAVRQMRRVVQRSSLVPFSSLSNSLQSLVTRPGARRLEIKLSDTMDAPSLVGFFHPAVVVPRSMWTELAADDLEAIVLHEKAHLDRGDDWTNLLQKLLRSFSPLNPALVWAERCLCREREQACDDAVLRAAGNARAYAGCLTRLAESRLVKRAAALAPGLWKHHSELAARVENILHPRRPTGVWLARGIITGCATISAMSAIFLAGCPGFVSFNGNGPTIAVAPMTRTTTEPGVRPSQFNVQASYQEAAFRAAGPLPVKRLAAKPRPRLHASHAVARVEYWQWRSDGDGTMLILFTVSLPRSFERHAWPAYFPVVSADDWIGLQI